MRKKIKLVLADKSVYEGYSFGAPRSTSGELVFTTGMVGYPESLSDPSYRGQILLFTSPLVGNYGVPDNTKDADGISHHFESEQIHAQGVIVSEYSENYSHWQAKKSLGEWLTEHDVPAITGIDTRALTQKLRDKGAQLAKIIYEEDVDWYDPNVIDIVKEVTIKEPITYKRGNKTVVLVDCGAKNNILRSLLQRNLTVIRVPYDYDFGNMEYDGLLISNGPGDPTQCTKTIENIRTALQHRNPVFGICLGSQLLALAAGGKTYKLKFGHRSQNQPATNVETGRCYITSQNHGFAIDTKSLPKEWKEWFYNANDKTNEGIKHTSKPFMSVQFHPEATPGPTDTNFLFDEFVGLFK